MDSEDGVMSLPFRLAISMLVVAIALPMCMQSLSDSGREVSRRAAVEAAREIAQVAEQISSRPVGESRVLWPGDDLSSVGPDISIVIGSLLGEASFAVIHCTDSTGWNVTVPVNLSPQIVGFCSFDLMPMTIGCDSGNLLISHCQHPIGELIQLGAA